MVLRRCTVIISVAAPFIRLLIVSRSAGVCLPLQRARMRLCPARTGSSRAGSEARPHTAARGVRHPDLPRSLSCARLKNGGGSKGGPF